MKTGILFCSDKYVCLRVLQYLTSINVRILYCVYEKCKSDSELSDFCQKENINFTDMLNYDLLLPTLINADLDIIISFDYPKIIDNDLISLAKIAISIYPCIIPAYNDNEKDLKWEVICCNLGNLTYTSNVVDSRSFYLPALRQMSAIELLQAVWEKCFELLVAIIEKLNWGGVKILSNIHWQNQVDTMPMLPLEKNGFVYRLADIHDYENIKCIVDEVFQFDLQRDNFITYYYKPYHKILLALKNSEPVGTLCMEKQCDYFNNKRTIVFVKNAGIRESFRRSGVFKQLYAIAYEFAKSINASALELTCANFRIPAHNFYTNNGFTKKKTTVFIKEIG